MVILWYADFDGDDRELKKLNGIFKEITDKIGGSFDGPYYPQNEALLYIFKVDDFDWLNQAGRIWFKRVEKEGIKCTPIRYEVAVTPREFWGK